MNLRLVLGVPAVLACGAVAAQAAPTFSKDVAPILQKHCQECHRPGEAVPMTLIRYEDARPWAKSILKVVQDREMPPWHADPSIGHWKNDRSMTEEEIAIVAGWVQGGAEQGDPADLPPPLEITAGWKIGEPDAVFTFAEPVVLPAELEDEYIYVTMKTDFAEDRWLKAIECRPGNVDVVHHIIAFAKPGNAPLRGDEAGTAAEGRGGRGRGNGPLGGVVALGGMAPGTAPMVMPEGMGVKLPAGADIVFQMHYHKEPGKQETDSSMIGIKFADYVVAQHKYSDAVSNFFFSIPPGEPNYEITAMQKVEEDIELQSIMPHMHLRGKSMRVWAKYPDGSEKDLLWVPKYDFNWQTIYEPAEPIRLPAGSKIYAKAAWDNSADNPHNPDPTQTVRFGEPTTDEMMFAFYSYTVPGENLAATDPSYKPASAGGEGVGR